MNNLLMENRYTLKSLAALGYDFKKPYGIYEGIGKFTLKSIEKETGDLTNCKAVVIFRNENKYHSTGELMITPIEDGKFTTIDILYHYFNGENRCFDNFCRKSDFEEARKHLQGKFYVVYQHKEHLRPLKEKSLDLSERVRISRDKYGNIRFRQGNYSERKGEHFGRIGNNDIPKFFDKSGYYLGNIKQDYKYRTTVLRIKKAKAAVDYNATAKEITAIQIDFAEIRDRIGNLILQGKLFEVTWKFKWLKNDIDKLENQQLEKSFASMEKFSEKIAAIRKDMQALNDWIKENRTY